MKPYYEHGGIVIYHGDCREILPQLPPCDAVITDPPYGIGVKTDYFQTREAAYDRDKGFRRHAWTSKNHPLVHGDDGPFDPSPWLGFKTVLLWGANNYADKLPSRYSWLVWDKIDSRGAETGFSDAELCWCSGVPFNSVRIFRHMWRGYQRDSEIGEGSLHPNQKPVALMKWCILKAGTPKSILDPYMGSGPTLAAAKQLDIPAYGIEIREEYCELSAKRLSQEVFQW